MIQLTRFSLVCLPLQKKIKEVFGLMPVDVIQLKLRTVMYTFVKTISMKVLTKVINVKRNN
jgi:hypothetical protein